jgi:uncharacterized membrane protein
MPSWLSAYLATGVVFVAADAVWLSIMAPRFYKPQLGALMRDQIALAPAIVFYLIYIAALTVLVVLPALGAHSATRALTHGLLFGLGAYATYDITNASILKGWPPAITYVDMAWGSVATGLAAWLAVMALSALRGNAPL